VRPYLDRIDELLVMTVNPGFGGQAFIHEMLPKIQQVAAWRRAKGLKFHIGVDGGIDFKTAAECAHAGADVFVSGTTLFGARSLAAGVRKIRKLVEAARPKEPAAALAHG
jgi:ribulose-phosphate 3-epimerase